MEPEAERLKKMLANMPNIISDLFSDDDTLVENAAKQIRIMLSFESNPPIQPLIDYGLVPRLLQIVQFGTPNSQYESAWALTNIASGTADQTAVVVDQGCIPIFVDLLKSPHLKLAEQVLWCLGNIAGDGVESRNRTMQGDTIANIMKLTKTPNSTIGLRKNICWTFSNFSRGKPQPPTHLIKQYIPFASENLDSKDEEVLIDTLWTFAFLSDTTSEWLIQHIIDLGAVPKIMKFLDAKAQLLTPALRTIGNILTCDDGKTQFVLDNGVIDYFKKLIDNPKAGIRKEVYWSISNITSGSAKQIDAIIASGVLKIIVENVNESKDIKKEMIWVLVNTTALGNEEHIKYLVDIGAPEFLIASLPLYTDDVRIYSLLMEGFGNILTYAPEHLEIEKVFKKHRFFEIIMELDLLSAFEGVLHDCGLYDTFARLKMDAAFKALAIDDDQEFDPSLTF